MAFTAAHMRTGYRGCWACDCPLLTKGAAVCSRHGRLLGAYQEGTTPAMTLLQRMRRVVHYGPALSLLAGISYLALRPSPELQTIRVLPRAVACFLDGNDFFCNVIGYVGLTAVMHWTWSGWSRPSVRAMAGRVAALAAVVTGLECAQLFLPRRHFDLMDIVAGLLGVAAASVPWWLAPAESVRMRSECKCP